MWTSVRLLLLSTLLTGKTVSERCPQICLCDSIKHQVMCLNKNLTKVPINIPQVTQRLDLRGNEIKVISAGTFLPIPYLTHMKLQRCKVESIEEGAFRGLGRLVYLNLASNNIAFIYQESLDGLSSLRQLILENNSIEEIKPGAFSQLGFLTFLNLARNSLVYLPDMVFQGLQLIKWINLSHNSLNVLANEAFGGLSTLRRLSLDHNELQFLPNEALSRLSGTAQLDLGHNPITYIGEEAIEMASLKQLFLDNMALQEVSHRAFVKSPLLHTLDLHNNQLSMLQSQTEMAHLKKIDLTGNPVFCTCEMRPFKEWAAKARIHVDVVCAGPAAVRGEHLESLRATDMKCRSHALGEELLPSLATVTRESEKDAVRCPQGCTCSPDSQHANCVRRNLQSIPKGFRSSTQLLDLRHNEFHSVPQDSFPGLRNLTSLHLQNCKIARLQPGAFQDLKNLIYLYLSNNNIDSVDADVFKGPAQLAYLYLDHNGFNQISKSSFTLLPNLFALHLQHNSIGQLDDNDLAGLEKLRWLYLTGNRITHMSPKALGHAKLLEKLHLDENHLQEVPTKSLRGLPTLSELKLSKNPIKYIGDGAFLPVARSLQHLYLDDMGLEQISSGAFTGLGPQIRSLYLEKNKVRSLPNLHGFTALEVINLSDVPFSCDCQLLPLRRWLDKLNLRVGATCGSPAEVRGQKVKLVTIFQSCPGWNTKKTKRTSSTKAKAKAKAGRSSSKNRQQQAGNIRVKKSKESRSRKSKLLKMRFSTNRGRKA
ncbi:chondroadherin-like protein [Lacerta agilis]|uniref:chondroadherin-like protein n=1 Tax=Lacerta agilis TaxID=80427 RepID=UPI00141A5914|nr:chondroadherin-like protein [Lacerta agilis]XP_033018897.1 chondroadherin-like protein [Lacerta agilis]